MPRFSPNRRWGVRPWAGLSALGLGLALALPAVAAERAAVPAGGASPSAISSPAPAPPEPPANRNDLQGWLAYQRALGSPSLPAAAQMFYRLGVETLRSGAQEDGVRMLRGACQLNPAFLAPRLALVGHFGLRDPSQSLSELARIIDLAKTQFPLQHYLVTTFAFRAGLAIFLATLAVGLFVVWRRREALRHGYEEILGQFLSPRIASVGAWALLALPYLAGLGLALPTAFTLAALWPALRRSERALCLLLVGLLLAVPLGYATVSHLAVPDHPDRPPFFGSERLANAPFSQARLDDLARLTARHPDNPFLHFATAWMAARGGQVELAEREFNAVGELWPNEPRIPNNLGNLAEMRGKNDEAEQLYRQAAALDPEWAMPHYNLGQLYTRQFRYAEASEELARATSFDFDMVRDLQADAQSSPGDAMAVAWGWLGPRTFWDALLAQPAEPGPAAAPPAWRGWMELRGKSITLLALLLTLLGAGLGVLMRAQLPVRQCSNCDGALCRRCAARRRDQVFCAGCSAALREATTPEFARLLLARRRRTLRRDLARRSLALAATLPGLGPLLLDRLAVGWVLLVAVAAGVTSFLGVTGPFPYDPRVGPLAPGQLHIGAVGFLAVVHLLSFVFYLVLRGSSDLREMQIESARKTAARLQRAA